MFPQLGYHLAMEMNELAADLALHVVAGFLPCIFVISGIFVARRSSLIDIELADKALVDHPVEMTVQCRGTDRFPLLFHMVVNVTHGKMSARDAAHIFEQFIVLLCLVFSSGIHIPHPLLKSEIEIQFQIISPGCSLVNHYLLNKKPVPIINRGPENMPYVLKVLLRFFFKHLEHFTRQYQIVYAQQPAFGFRSD